MERHFRTPQEEGLYGTLKNVLATYIVQQHVSYHTTLNACAAFMAAQLVLMYERHEEIPSLLAVTQQALREAEQERVTCPLPSFHAGGLVDAAQAQTGMALSNSLLRLLVDAVQEQDISAAGTWRACVACFADVLAMPRCDASAETLDLDAYLAALPQHLLPVMQEIEQQWGGGGAP